MRQPGLIIGLIALLSLTAWADAPLIAVDSLRIEISGNNVVLHWAYPAKFVPGDIDFIITKISAGDSSIFYTEQNNYSEPFTAGNSFYTISFSSPYYLGLDETVLEDFEDGSVTLTSYSAAQDREPNSWSVQATTTFNNSDYALQVYGNTWKVQSVSPFTAAENTMFGIAVDTYHSGSSAGSEICAFGVGDGSHELFYNFRGTDLTDSINWRNTYFCVGNENTWQFFYLPIGVDWFNAYGYYPVLNRFIYLNDEDNWASNGGIYFDYICDITGDMPIAPELTVDFEMIYTYETPAGMTFQFTAEAEDPDSDTLFYLWEFGEGWSSELQNPIFTFPAEGYYTVEAEVRDETGLVDLQTIHIEVPLGVNSGTITANFAGDAMMARRYEEPGGWITVYGADTLWTQITPIFGEGADLSFCNLECVFTTDLSTPHPTKEYVFAGNPNNLDALVNAGVDGVTLANNHVMDYLNIGMYDTQEGLDSRGIERCGSGANDYQSNLPMVHFREGVSVANLGYCNRTGRADNLPPFMESGPNKPGFTWFTEYYLQESVPQAAALYDIVVVQVHCGTEYDENPDTSLGGDWNIELPAQAYLEVDSTTLDLQYSAIDMGADLVVAHHPHILQGYEVYNGKLIAHSMGNFVFEQQQLETMYSMILYANMDRDGIHSCYFRPVMIDDYIPKPATGELGKAIIDKIADLSRDMNAVVLPVYEENLAFIALDPAQISSTEIIDTVTVVFPDSLPDTTYSNPMQMEKYGSLSNIISFSGIPMTQVEVKYGREIMYFGGFEDEGSSIWNMGSNSSVLFDQSIKHSGNRSIKVYAQCYQSAASGTEMEDKLVIDDDKDYTLGGYIKGINTDQAALELRYYGTRYGTVPINIQAVEGNLTGTFDWQFVSADLDIPTGGFYGTVGVRNSSPVLDDSWAWFDDVTLIEWEDDWQPASLEIPHPNNYRWAKFRILAGYQPAAEVVYQMVQYDGKELWYSVE